MHLHFYLELQITPVPVALDNYSYIILDTESNTCVVIDPGDPVVVQVHLNLLYSQTLFILDTCKQILWQIHRCCIMQRFIWVCTFFNKLKKQSLLCLLCQLYSHLRPEFLLVDLWEFFSDLVDWSFSEFFSF